MTIKPFYQDPFSPLLFSSEELIVSQEQKNYIKKILDIACSDSRFAAKAYDAITLVLTAGSVTMPVVTGLSPSSATLGGPNFTLHVTGTGFTEGSTIVFNDGLETTTYVSPTELTTGVDMSTAGTAVTVGVAVLSAEGVPSNTMPFEFQAVVNLSAPSKPIFGQATKTVTPAKLTEVKK